MNNHYIKYPTPKHAPTLQRSNRSIRKGVNKLIISYISILINVIVSTLCWSVVGALIFPVGIVKCCSNEFFLMEKVI